MSTETWFLPAMTALCLWGGTAFVPKILLLRMQPLHMIVYSSVFFFFTAVAVQFIHAGDFHFDPHGAMLAMATGACGSFGQIFYLEALRRGPISYVTMISSLYPLVATLLAFLVLHEPLTARQGVAVALGLGAIITLVLASDKPKAGAKVKHANQA